MPRGNCGPSWSLGAIKQIPVDCGIACTLKQVQSKCSNITDNNVAVPDELNALYAHFEQKVNGGVPPAPTVMGAPYQQLL